MAEEIQLTVRLLAEKDGVKLADFGANVPLALDLAGDDGQDRTFDVTQAADVQLPIPSEIATIGLIVGENLDDTNYFEFSYGTGGAFAAGVFQKVRAGFPFVFQPTNATIYAKANVADVRIKFSVLPE